MPRRVYVLTSDLNVEIARMDEFLCRIRTYLDSHARELLPLFDTMAAEAKFARQWLNADLARLSGQPALLEVGGGVFLLSCQLAVEGFDITAIEPTGEGFNEFKRLGDIVLELADIKPTIAPCKAEDFVSDRQFDFAFSLNVMEHIDLPEEAIARVSDVLKPGASYHFMCPNYVFPYEPHFNMPTVLTKRLTARVMRRRIQDSSRMEDPGGVWRSLNWITVPKVARFARRDPRLTFDFDRGTMVSMLERALMDEQFASRRPDWMVSGIRIAAGMRLHRLAGLIPATLQPVMDVRLTKKS